MLRAVSRSEFVRRLPVVGTTAIPVIGLMVFAFVLFRTAWVCDDAYISF
jgi:hypothetical protein